jgi:dynein heavy chain
MLEEWLLCQGKWLYLEPIFSAEEIMKQIPTEGAAFRSMDASWRSIMNKVWLQWHCLS